MKKLFVVIVVLMAAAFNANAQFRIEAAGNCGWYSIEGNSMDFSIAPKVTAYYEFSLGSLGGIEVGLGYTMFSMKNDILNNEKLGSTLTVSNIQFPFRGTLEWEIGNNFSITPMIGFYLGCAVSGKTTDALGGVHNPFEGDQGLQRFDLGTDDELVFTFAKKFDIAFGVQKSFLNLCKDKRFETNAYAFYFGLGYRF